MRYPRKVIQGRKQVGRVGDIGSTQHNSPTYSTHTHTYTLAPTTTHPHTPTLPPVQRVPLHAAAQVCAQGAVAVQLAAAVPPQRHLEQALLHHLCVCRCVCVCVCVC